MINVAIIGHGTVGSGVAEILIDKSELLKKSLGEEINVKYILDIRKFENLSYLNKFTDDFSVILNDESIKTVIETMGGLSPAYEFVLSCLNKGKNVVTSNKELVAQKGDELLRVAKENGVSFLFEASVGGGIPVIHPLINCLVANEITEIKGIFNGTTNYILNKMILDGEDFGDALKMAQDKGFAEKDPTADIEGFDACRKICILASIAFGHHIYPSDVSVEGITDISLDDIDYANSFNCVIKLIAKAKKNEDGTASISVKPTLVDRNYVLSHVNGVFNAVSVTGDSVGEVLFYGKGAGKEATASAVVSDVVESLKSKAPSVLLWESEKKGFVKNDDSVKEKYFVKVQAFDYNGLIESAEKVFGSDLFFIKNEDKKEIAFMTNKESFNSVNKKIGELKADKIKVLSTLM